MTFKGIGNWPKVEVILCLGKKRFKKLKNGSSEGRHYMMEL
jgi:hypothetical protein